LFHVLDVYPPWGQPMWEPGLNLLALSYRIVYGVLGSYLTARFAPRNPMKHAIIGGAIGFVFAALGAVAALIVEMGPLWYPILLALTALPCAWLGGVLHRATRAA
jgi:Na+-transporting NADH:ubiquinone oxidoreductase subunit NqrB